MKNFDAGCRGALGPSPVYLTYTHYESDILIYPVQACGVQASQPLKLKAFLDLWRQIRNLFCLISRLQKIFTEDTGRTGGTIYGFQQEQFSKKFPGLKTRRFPLSTPLPQPTDSNYFGKSGSHRIH
jgi:hypothetical protein